MKKGFGDFPAELVPFKTIILIEKKAVTSESLTSVLTLSKTKAYLVGIKPLF